MIRVAMIEDDPVSRRGLADILREISDIDLVLMSPTVEAFNAKRRLEIDVVILDLRLRGGRVTGTEAVRDLAIQDWRILVFTVNDKEGPVLSALRAGALGYVTKDAEPEEIVRAIRCVERGELYISPTVAGFLVRTTPKLSRRETEVLCLVGNGESTRDISKILGIDESTVNGTLDRIRNKTGLRRRPELMKYAIDSQLEYPQDS